MTTDYAELYQTAWNDIPEEQVLPGGHWTMENCGLIFLPSKGEGKSPMVGLFHKPVAPGGDVDKRAMKDIADYDFSENEIASFEYYGNRKDMRKVATILGMYGVELPNEPLVVEVEGTLKVNPKVREALKGARIQALLKIGTDRRTNEATNEVVSFIPVEG